MPSSLIGAKNDIKENNNIYDNSRKYVEAMEARNKEKEVRKESISIFIMNEICSLDYSYSSIELLQ